MCKRPVLIRTIAKQLVAAMKLVRRPVDNLHREVHAQGIDKRSECTPTSRRRRRIADFGQDSGGRYDLTDERSSEFSDMLVGVACISWT